MNGRSRTIDAPRVDPDKVHLEQEFGTCGRPVLVGQVRLADTERLQRLQSRPRATSVIGDEVWASTCDGAMSVISTEGMPSPGDASVRMATSTRWSRRAAFGSSVRSPYRPSGRGREEP